MPPRSKKAESIIGGHFLLGRGGSLPVFFYDPPRNGGNRRIVVVIKVLGYEMLGQYHIVVDEKNDFALCFSQSTVTCRGQIRRAMPYPADKPLLMPFAESLFRRGFVIRSLVNDEYLLGRSILSEHMVYGVHKNALSAKRRNGDT